jgi:hypothetical protein
MRILGLFISYYLSSSLPEDTSKPFLFSSFKFVYNFSLSSFASKLMVGNHFWPFCCIFVIMGKSSTYLWHLAYILLSEILNEIGFANWLLTTLGMVKALLLL